MRRMWTVNNMARPKWLSAGDIVLLASIAVGSIVLLVTAGGWDVLRALFGY